MTDTHDTAAAKLTGLAEMIANTLPDGTHFALVIATPLDKDTAETAHVTNMETGTMVSLVLAHVEAVIDGHGDRSAVKRSGRA